MVDLTKAFLVLRKRTGASDKSAEHPEGELGNGKMLEEQAGPGAEQTGRK